MSGPKRCLQCKGGRLPPVVRVLVFEHVVIACGSCDTRLSKRALNQLNTRLIDLGGDRIPESNVELYEAGKLHWSHLTVQEKAEARRRAKESRVEPGHSEEENE